MQKKSQDFSLEEAKRLAQTPAGQRLMALMRASDSGLLEQAAQQANAGNYQMAAHTLRDLLSLPEAQQLIKELGR